MLKSNTHGFLYVILIFSFSTGLPAASWPIDGGQASAPLTSAYGPRLKSGHYDFHYGVDIRTSANTTVMAVHDGLADWVGENAGYGNMIFLGDANWSYATGYAHLDSYTVALDSIVLEGDQIAVSGGSPPHLHFNYYTRNVYESFIQDFHPVDANAGHPMAILPYECETNPVIPADSIETYESPGHQLHALKFDLLIASDELDLNYLQLTMFDDIVLTDLHNQLNINREDSPTSQGPAQVTTFTGNFGEVEMVVMVYNFEPEYTYQRLTIAYNFQDYDNGTIEGYVPASALGIQAGDIEGNWTPLPPFTSGITSEGGLR
ncbi:MAG: M23 family metallopeptidase [Candidatus Marinimicrobia bacterium]|nr:M23 family metallopeptidase [Candidatus Neomarinimicrobiota bacterium]